jgi:hypothetical protein
MVDDCGPYQCARTTDSTVVMPATIEPAIAIAAGMPRGSSQLTTAAMNIAARDHEITSLDAPDMVRVDRLIVCSLANSSRRSAVRRRAGALPS